MTAADDLRAGLTQATQHLLGATITVDEDQWRAPSRCPGWTRGHVATHLARNADALGRLIRGAIDDQPAMMYDSETQRDSEIAAGAARHAIELQRDLDASAAALDVLFDEAALTDNLNTLVTMRGGGPPLPVSILAVHRLAEVTLHHHDLDIGFQLADLDPAMATRLLEWAVARMSRKPDQPLLTLTWDGGSLRTGAGEPVATIRGTPTALLGWLYGRDAGPVDGAEGITLPAY